MIKRVLSKIENIGKQLKSLYLVAKHYNWLKRLCNASLLSNNKSLLITLCPICKSDEISLLARIPLGAPGFQNHSLLYFDSSTIINERLTDKREVLDVTLGFFLSVPWYFCNYCKNARIGMDLDSTHLLNYYSNFYKRKNPSDSKRKTTKELHGRFMESLLNGRNKILEIGAAEGFTAEYLADEDHEVYVYEPSNFQDVLKEKTILKYIHNLENNLNGNFDAVYMHHVLEHIYDPVNYLKKLHHLLKVKGIIILQVPDLSLQIEILKRMIKKYIYSLFNPPIITFENISYNFQNEKAYGWFDALLNDHVSAFTPEGLYYIVESSGYTVEKVIRSTKDTITVNLEKYSWPVDETTGNNPNGLTIVARKV